MGFNVRSTPTIRRLRYFMDQPNMNMRQQRWLDVVRDYDCEILYHPGKANMVVDSLSRKAVSSSIRDIFLRMVVTSHFLDLIKKD